ncbi:MAG: tetratricopeptide repeat protein [Muribaculaceae bacterium]|nr:tetratricopeptide repeat protein [Muribaculaceae bacterium]
MLRYIIIFATLALAMAGCSGREVDRDLDDAERLMESQPDISLQILQRLDSLPLQGERQARHALLLSQAYYKNNMDHSNDSLISIAVNYYERTDNAYYKMLSYQYLGINNLLNGFYGPALHATLNAHDQAAELADTLNLARTESVLGQIFTMACDYKEALRWDLMSLENAKRVNHTDWLRNTYENIAAEYLAMGQYDAALIYADSAMRVSSTPSSDALYTQFQTYFALNLDDMADSVLAIMKERDIPLPTTVNESLVYLEQRTDEEIIDHQNQVIEQLNNYILDLYSKNLSSSLNQYNDDKTRRMNEVIERRKTQIVNITVFGVLGLAVLTLFFVIYRLRVKAQRRESDRAFQILSIDLQRAQQEVESRRLAILNMQKDMEHLSQQATDAQQQVADAQQEVADARLQVAAARRRAEDALQGSMELRNKASVTYIKRFEWVNKIAQLYSAAQGPKAEKQLYEAITTEINKFDLAVFIEEIEKLCREHHPELWSEINDLYLRKNDRDTLLLMIAGISPSVISMLFNKSTNAIYSIKRRIKAKLQKANATLSLQLISEI